MAVLSNQISMKISLHRLVYLLLLGVLTFTLVSACSRNIDLNATSLKQPLENCRVVQHVMGKTCIPRNPQRIVTLWMSTFSSALALGIKPITYTAVTKAIRTVRKKRAFNSVFVILLLS